MSVTLSASGTLYRSTDWSRETVRPIGWTSKDATIEFGGTFDLTDVTGITFPIQVSTQLANMISFLYITAKGGSAVIRLIRAGAWDLNPSVVEVTGEVPDGVINGTNNTFTLDFEPITDTERVYVNGVRKISGTAYTVSGADIVFEPTFKPTTGQTLIVDYRYNSSASPIPEDTQVLDLTVSGTILMSGINLESLFIMSTSGVLLEIIGAGIKV